MTARLADPSLEAALRVTRVAALYLNGHADRESLRAAVEDYDRLLLLPPPPKFSTPQGSLALGGGGGTSSAKGGEPRPRERRIRRQRTEAVSWLSVYGDAWKAAYQGVPPWGSMAKAFAELHKERGEAEVLQRWKNYLFATDARYASPFRFAQTYGRWAGPTPAKADDWNEQRPGESIDGYIARLAQGRPK